VRPIGVWSYNDLAQEAEYSLTESALSPFQAEPTQDVHPWLRHELARLAQSRLRDGRSI